MASVIFSFVFQSCILNKYKLQGIGLHDSEIISNTLIQYFKIEKHPKLDKILIGCKSNNISIKEKLNQINKIIDDLEKDIYPEQLKDKNI